MESVINKKNQPAGKQKDRSQVIESPGQIVLKRLLKNKFAMLGFIVLIARGCSKFA